MYSGRRVCRNWRRTDSLKGRFLLVCGGGNRKSHQERAPLGSRLIDHGGIAKLWMLAQGRGNRAKLHARRPRILTRVHPAQVLDIAICQIAGPVTGPMQSLWRRLRGLCSAPVPAPFGEPQTAPWGHAVDDALPGQRRLIEDKQGEAFPTHIKLTRQCRSVGLPSGSRI